MCAGKSKSFAISKAWLAAAILTVAAAPEARAATAVDFPVFRWAGRWTAALGDSAFPVLPPVPSVSPDDRTAVETILLEAAGDGFESMIAVGETIRNRMTLFEKNARDVCLQPRQFSGWNDRARAAEFLREHRAFYGRAWLAWKLSSATALTRGATDYHTEDILPYWAPRYVVSARVGSHIFYVRQARRIRE